MIKQIAYSVRWNVPMYVWMDANDIMDKCEIRKRGYENEH